MTSELAQTLTERGAILEMGDALRSGRARSVELTAAALERIERLDRPGPAGSIAEGINAFIAVRPEAALEAAAKADARIGEGAALGPLDGVPYALKDLIDAEGWPTTGGARILEPEPKRRDAGVTARLRDAGGVLLGKTGLHELAYGVTSENPHFGPVRNPWDRTRSPGGSSGGSAAAVAAAMAPLALGTDTGCSVRHPAHCCGVVGLKLSHGRVSCAGVLPLVRQLDHVGPLARGVMDAALAADALAGFDPEDPFCAQFEEPLAAADAVTYALLASEAPGLRLGRLRGEGFEQGDPETLRLVSEAMEAVAARLGAALVDFTPPRLASLWRAASILFAGDPSATYGQALRRAPQRIGPDVRAKLEHGMRVGAGALAAAQQEARAFRRAVAEAQNAAGLDVLLAPTCGAPAPLIAAPADARGGAQARITADPWADFATINCTPFNVTGQPAVSIPCGRTAAGLPVGLMLVGAFGQDAALLGAAARAERALAEEGLWTGERPPL